MTNKISKIAIGQNTSDKIPLILYLCRTSRFEYYVLAHHPTEAKDKIESILEEEDYGFTSEREVKEIILVAKQIMPALNSKHFLSGDGTLLI